MPEPTLPERLDVIEHAYLLDTREDAFGHHTQAVVLATLDAVEARLRDRMSPHTAYVRASNVVDELRASLAGVPPDGAEQGQEDQMKRALRKKAPKPRLILAALEKRITVLERQIGRWQKGRARPDHSTPPLARFFGDRE